MGRLGTEAPAHPLALRRLGLGMVDLEHADPFDPSDPVGAAVEAGAQQHDLVEAGSQRLAQGVVDEARAHHHGQPGPG